MDKAAEGGITFIDTADVYPLGGTGETVGRTEEIVGRWLKGRRDDFIQLSSRSREALVSFSDSRAVGNSLSGECWIHSCNSLGERSCARWRPHSRRSLSLRRFSILLIGYFSHDSRGSGIDESRQVFRRQCDYLPSISRWLTRYDHLRRERRQVVFQRTSRSFWRGNGCSAG